MRMRVAYHLLKRGALLTFHELEFSYKRTFMENPNKTKPFCSLLSRRVFLRDRGSVLHEQLLLVRLGFSFPLRIKTWLDREFFQDYRPWRLSAPLFVWKLLEENLGLGSLRSLLPQLLDRF